jgi:hypothetical protein
MQITSKAIGLALGLAAMSAPAARAEIGPGGAEWIWSPAPEVVEAVPPLPPPTLFPVQLVLDDDNSEGAFGVSGQASRQFIWFNQFSPAAGFHLQEVWVLFPSGANMAVGGAVQIAIYADPDGDPSNGAVLVSSFDTTIQAVDGNTFSIYPLGADVTIPDGADVLIGVVPRFIVSGVTPPTAPAALDTTVSVGRSWVGIWSADPPDPPALVPPPDQALALVDTFVPGGGNWMIRGFGVSPAIIEIPTLDVAGLVLFAAVLGALSLIVVRRRRA